MVDHGHRDMEGWGVYSIFKEAGRLLHQDIRILRPFILAFILPLVVIVFLEVIGIAWLLTWDPDQTQPHHLGGIFGHHLRHSGLRAFHAAFVKAPAPPVPDFHFDPFLFVRALIFLLSTIAWLLGSLASAAIATAIHHIYSSNSSSSSSNTSPNEDESSSETQTLIQSIFTSLPHSFYRIFIISLCFFVVDISAYFLIDLAIYLVRAYKYGPNADLAPPDDSLLWNLLFLTLDFWFLVSVQVVVLESRYDGWAALQRSARLVKAKAATALGLLVVYFAYFVVFNVVVMVAAFFPAHLVVLYVAAVAVALGYLAAAAFWAVVVTVFYFVSKRKWSAGGGEEEQGRHAQGDQYQSLGVLVEN